MSSTPVVSIVVPVYNMGRMIGRTLRSYLEQSERDIEVIVSDNASTDDTAEVVASVGDARVRYVRNASNIGMINNFNAALKLARGEWVTYVAADEFAHGRDSLEKRLALAQADPEIDFVWCGYDFEHEDGGRIYDYEMKWPARSPMAGGEVLAFLLTRADVTNPRITTVMFRRAILAAMDYRIPLVHGGDQLVAATWLMHSRKAAYVRETLHRSYIHASHSHALYGRKLPYIGEGPLLMLRYIDEWRPRLIAMRFPIVRAEAVQLWRLARLIAWMPDFEFDNFWHYTAYFARRASRLALFCLWAPFAWLAYALLRLVRAPYWWLRRSLARVPLARRLYDRLRGRGDAAAPTKIIPR
jgi:glycosyltransferase involved in cell wall biosynthesis